MLKEYWASTVIFIRIFSQCTKPVAWIVASDIYAL